MSRWWWVITLCLLALGCARHSGLDPAALPLPPPSEMDPQIAALISEQVERVEASGRRDGSTWGELAEVLDAHDFADAAIHSYREAQRLAPANPDWPYLRGQVSLRRGDVESARLAFADAARIARDDPSIQLAVATAANRSGDFEAARTVLADLLERDPENAMAWQLQGEAALALGDLESAEAFFRRVLTIQPEAGAAAARLLAVLSRRHTTDDAEMDLLGARADRSSVSQPDARLARVRGRRVGLEADVESAHAAFSAGRFAAAEQRWRRVLVNEPDEVRGLIGLSAALVRQGRIDEGEVLLRRAAEVAPGNALVHFNLAVIAARRGDDASVIALARNALELDPHLHDARFNLANALRRLGRLEDASVELERLLESQPSRGPAWHLLAVVRADQDEWAGAKAALGQGLEYAPSDPGLRRAWVSLLAAAPDQQLRDPMEARKLAHGWDGPEANPLQLEAWAMAEAANGQWRSAQAAAQRAVGLLDQDTHWPPAVKQRIHLLVLTLASRELPSRPALD